VTLFTLRLLPPLLKKGKGRSRRPRFRLSPTSPRHRGGPPAFRAFNVVVLALNHSESSAPTRSSKPSPLATPSGGTEKLGNPATPTASSCRMAPVQAILVVLHTQMQVHLQTSDANSEVDQRLQHNGVSSDHKRRRFLGPHVHRTGKVLSAVTQVKKMSLLEAFTECESPGQHSRGDISARRAYTWLLSVLMPDILTASPVAAGRRHAMAAAAPHDPNRRPSPGADSSEREGSCRNDWARAVDRARASTSGRSGTRYDDKPCVRTPARRKPLAGSLGQQRAWARSGAWPPRAQTGKARYLSALR
jgi:hypothetical protein